jgi:hypothetical protein
LILPVIFDRTIKPYILILAFIFAVSFLAGTLAPLQSGMKPLRHFNLSLTNTGGLAAVPSSSISYSTM